MADERELTSTRSHPQRPPFCKLWTMEVPFRNEQARKGATQESKITELRNSSFRHHCVRDKEIKAKQPTVTADGDKVKVSIAPRRQITHGETA
jgi:hypothetical protein